MKCLNLCIILFSILIHSTVFADFFCPALPPPTGSVIRITPSQAASLQHIVDNAASGSTILLADGYYPLDGQYLRLDHEGISIRGASGNRENVILDGGYSTEEIIQVVASNVTIADLTLEHAYYHPIHIFPNGRDIVNTRIYNVHIIDPGQQAIKINPDGALLHFADDGEIACSRIELTDSGRETVWDINDSCYTGGVDAHQARNWLVRDNIIEGFWCEQGLAEHGIHFWSGSRDTRVLRNRLLDNVRGIGFGLTDSGSARTYSDDPCPGTNGYVGHYNGLIANNFIFQTRAALRDSQYGFDSGIALAQACGAKVLHNTVFSTSPPFSSIEYRFSNTSATITNNLTSHTIMERENAKASLAGNVVGASPDLFVDSATGDLHLTETASAAINKGIDTSPEAAKDIDGQTRSVPPDAGADEYIACHPSLKDCIVTLQIIAGYPATPGNCPLMQADIDQDGTLELADALALLQSISEE